MKRNNRIDDELERLKHLERHCAGTHVDSEPHRELVRAIRIEAALYRKSLDIAQVSDPPRRVLRSSAQR